jgi:two-component system CheB/CheR fusion protein
VPTRPRKTPGSARPRPKNKPQKKRATPARAAPTAAAPPPKVSAAQHDEPRRLAPFPIVGIGASAGGLEAFTHLLAALPPDTGMGFVLVQHLDPDHESALTQILSRATSLPVHEITNDEVVEPNHVYVIPPDTNLSIAGGVLEIRAPARPPAPHRSIDAFFESLALDQRERAVGVVLSGTANDGTIGLEAIKAEGGITFAQDDSAKHDSMPRSAIAAGCVDLVLSPADIAKELARVARHPYVAGQPLLVGAEDGGVLATGHDDSPAKVATSGYGKILSLLRSHSGVDFSLYKPTTIGRRIARRLLLTKQATLSDYARFLRGNAEEVDALYADVLISVTSFFRNPETFDFLERKILPELVRRRGDDPLRFWVVGCSTGQEAYSIAMTLVEAAEKAARTRKLQVFATDVNDALLEKARRGLYAKSLVADITPLRLRRFFVETDGGYRVNKTLRDMVMFARQNLIADPPFSRMDLVSCRNLLIYLEASGQKKAIPSFHYALKPGGYLVLGASESIGGFSHLFEPTDRKHKIFSKKPASMLALHLPERDDRDEVATPRARAAMPRHGGNEPPEGPRGELNAQREADRITVSQFAPPGVLVNAELQVLQFRGATGAFLEPPTGNPSFDVLKMARGGLMLPLRSAIQQARKQNKTARKENIAVRRSGKTRRVNLEVIPLKNLRERCFLILFEETRRASHGRDPADSEPARADGAPERERFNRIAELETELTETREYLQSMQEQLETANEEFQAANEEIQSANEELQSSNEELETSKEELESTNEELSTVNEEMSNRNVELNRLNDDLVNLQTASRVAIVLLGRDLAIRRFDPQAQKQLDLLAADVGRPIGHIRHELVLGDATQSPLDLEGLCSEVVSTGREREREVRDAGGRWYSLRVRPYVTLDNAVDGAVLVLVDIDTLKRSEQALADAERRKDEFVAMLGHELRNPLSALSHALDLLGSVSDDRGRSEELRAMMVRQTQRIGTLLDQLLDIARLTSGKVVLSKERVDLADVVRAAVETVGHLVEARKQELTLALPRDESALVLGDAVRLALVVENLLTNASKYTNEGGRIAVKLESGDDNHRIVIRDTGTGMSAELLPHVFDVFMQAPRTLDRAMGGLGLGLPLVKRLVEMHEGHVDASSPGLGQGSEFVVTLPRLREGRPAHRPKNEPAPAHPELRRRRILVVDDEAEVAVLFTGLLKANGHQAFVVHDGPSALEAVRSFAPDVVILDLGMPKMDGYEVARRIREEHADEKILLIAATGYQKNEARLKQAGFDQHLIKPIDMQRLSALMADFDGGAVGTA